MDPINAGVKQEILDTDSQESPTTFQFELSEYDNVVPFKIIKLEQDEEPGLLSVAQPLSDSPGPSNIDNSGTSTIHPDLNIVSGPPNKRAKESSTQKSKRICLLENELSNDAYSSDDDLGVNNNSETDSEYEYCSDSDDPFESQNGTANVLDDADTNDNLLDRPPTPEWTFDPTSMIKLKCTKKRELRIAPPQTPYDAFRLFLNDELLDILVQETNKYAARICNKPFIRLKPRFESWTDVTREEMITFLGLLLHTGTIRTTRLGDYWKQDYLFNLTCFSKFMSKDRFLLILNCLNFGPPSYFHSVRSNISKIQHIINNFNATMTKVYYPGKELILAKSLVCWRGQMVRLEYIDHRRQRDGINVYLLMEPNGTVIQFQVFSVDIHQKNLKVKAGKIVKDLLEHYQGNGHAIYMDKCYSSWKLATNLLDSQTYCTGTLSKHSKENMFEMTGSDLQKQSNQSFFLNGVHIGKWVDNNKSVLYISTEFDDQLQKVIQQNGIVSSKPKALINYSKFMTASNLHHQLMSYYPCGSKSLRWYKKLFIHFLQIYVGNAHQLYNNYSGKKKVTYYDFRLALLRVMLPEVGDAPPRTLQSSHALTKITKVKHRCRTDKDGKVVREVIEIVRKECIMCRKMKVRKGTPFECLGCEGAPGFCTSCFCQFHSIQLETNQHQPPVVTVTESE